MTREELIEKGNEAVRKALEDSIIIVNIDGGMLSKDIPTDRMIFSPIMNLSKDRGLMLFDDEETARNMMDDVLAPQDDNGSFLSVKITKMKPEDGEERIVDADIDGSPDVMDAIDNGDLKLEDLIGDGETDDADKEKDDKEEDKESDDKDDKEKKTDESVESVNESATRDASPQFNALSEAVGNVSSSIGSALGDVRGVLEAARAAILAINSATNEAHAVGDNSNAIIDNISAAQNADPSQSIITLSDHRAGVQEAYNLLDSIVGCLGTANQIANKLNQLAGRQFL